MKLSFTLTFTLMISFLSLSQETIPQKSVEKTIDSIYQVSSSWKFYKLIKKDRYEALKKIVLDSLNHYKSDINQKAILIKKQQDSIQNAKKTIDDLRAEVKLSLDKKNELILAGISLQKSTFQLVVGSITLTLLLLLGYFIFKFRRGHTITRNAKSELLELKEEFSEHKKKVLVREQKLRRQLQDEINKQRNNQA